MQEDHTVNVMATPDILISSVSMSELRHGVLVCLISGTNDYMCKNVVKQLPDQGLGDSRAIP